jgi:hypothetical protein
VWGTAKPISGAKQFRSGATVLSSMSYNNNKRISLSAYFLAIISRTFMKHSWTECDLSYLSACRRLRATLL